MAAKPVRVEAFASTKAPRVVARPPEDPDIAAAQRLLNEALLHTAPLSHEHTDVRDRRRPVGVPMPIGTQLKLTSALRPARARLGPAADILLGGANAPGFSTTFGGNSIFGHTLPADQLGATLDPSALPIDPKTGEPAVDAEVQRLTQMLTSTGQLASSTKVRRVERESQFLATHYACGCAERALSYGHDQAVDSERSGPSAEVFLCRRIETYCRGASGFGSRSGVMSI